MRTFIVVVLVLLAGRAFADDGSVPASAAAGKEIYSQTCVACHAANGKGAIPGVPDLAGKESPLAKSDEELIKNITEGFQSPGAALAMPAKGGNPTLTENDVASVLAYLREAFGAR